MRHMVIRVRSALIAIVVLALSAGLAFGAQPPAAASTGLANAGAHSGKVVPVAGAQTGDDLEEGEDADEAGDDVDDDADDEDGDDLDDVDGTEDDETGDETGEETEDDLEGDEEGTEEGTEDEAAAGGNCLLDPRLLTEDELAAMNHGSIVCWAAHQTEWPEEFKNHGAWVKSWAQWGKDDDETLDDETLDGETDEGEAEDGETVDEDDAVLEDASPDRGKGHGKGNGKGKAKGKSKHNRG